MRPHGSFTPRLTANGSFTPRLSPTAARAKEQREIEEAAADTADRWLLSADQRARVHALFARIDVNHDGVISMGEMTAYMHGDKRQALELLFEMDDNYDGEIQAKEFSHFFDRIAQHEGAERLAQMLASAEASFEPPGDDDDDDGAGAGAEAPSPAAEGPATHAPAAPAAASAASDSAPALAAPRYGETLAALGTQAPAAPAAAASTADAAARREQRSHALLTGSRSRTKIEDARDLDNVYNNDKGKACVAESVEASWRASRRGSGLGVRAIRSSAGEICVPLAVSETVKQSFDATIAGMAEPSYALKIEIPVLRPL